MTTSCSNIRVVVGIDFGTTYSGFAYANVANPEKIETNETWLERKGAFKTNTVIRYDENFELIQWGLPALAEKINKKSKNSKSDNSHKIAELFKLHIGEIPYEHKPPLPSGLNPRKAITDYLREMGKIMKSTISARWPGLIYYQHVRVILTVPVEYDEGVRAIMRQCAFDAELILTLESENLEFTTEPEAAALYCLENLNEHPLKVGDSFLVIDCGGGTVDLTVRTILPNSKLSELTESTGDFCGSTYVDKAFKHFIGTKIGRSALKLMEEKHYPQFQYLIQYFCTDVKLPFDGDERNWRNKEIDLEEICPILLQYVKGEEREELEECEWVIELDFQTVKYFFDQAIENILKLIRQQLTKSEKNISAIFLVGGFSESKYLMHCVRQEFNRQVSYISVPSYPVTSIVKGAVTYGLRMDAIKTRVLRKTYGIELYRNWTPNDPIERKEVIDDQEKMLFFKRLAKKGTEVDVDQEFKNTSWPTFPNQKISSFKLYTTSENDGKHCDDPGMKLFGRLGLELPDVNLGINRPVEFTLTFGKMETRVFARDLISETTAKATFKLEL
ncbi:11627_t:CDS:2 [Ambispora gerdemannii]|uniref:11627_t:CDS:1 n=1 Tax=Ambispora gerdemannii TaxID=144530 RepID=A0A9N9DTB7_9GLOM|nr:11627_t:CDS:2 [Ambispora gerdemannii]